ncbi:MAG: c-type cytochrome [Acidobacteria bacterium]|nr:c-type cytochrome [Acidobacteriota bacterium]
MKLEQYVSPAEFRRLMSALAAVAGFIAINAFFGFLVVPGIRNANHPAPEALVAAPQGETGWLDPTDYPAAAKEFIPPIDPQTVMTPNPALMERGRAVYEKTCATCHGPQGKGDGPGATGLNPKPRNFAVKEGWKVGTRVEDIYRTLEEGIKGSSMVSYNDLSRRDRMALVHVVQSLGSFDHGASDPKAREALEKLFASAGETIPNRIPVKAALGRLEGEFLAPPALPLERPEVGRAVRDARRAAQTLAAIPGWKDSDLALAKGVLPDLPANGFAPAVATYSPEEWKQLRSALAGR